MAAIIQIIDPIAIEPNIPSLPTKPEAFSAKVDISKVAIAIPDTGLLLLPTSPTSLEETVAKKKPNTAISTAPSKLTGIVGINHIDIITAKDPSKTTFIDISLSVLKVLLSPFIE